MRTKASDNHPAIEWTRYEYVEMGMYNCAGESDDGRQWIGMWWDYEIEIVITNIEEA